jgi:hypothetical protein
MENRQRQDEQQDREDEFVTNTTKMKNPWQRKIKIKIP